MTSLRRSHAHLLALLAAGLLCALAAAGASAATVWLCRPGLANDPCTPGLTTALTNPASGVVASLEHIAPVARPQADCFYVYPTVSDQKTTQADLTIDPVERSIALYQAAYYSRYCRVYAPMYRQITLTAANAGGAATGMPTGAPANPANAFADVDHAWLDYLHHDNRGRPVVFIGHSQGSGELEQLLAKEVDPKPAVRRLLLSALILGGNVTVKDGSQVGGTFQNIPACRSTTQLGCVVAFSSFATQPPEDTFLGETANAGQHVLCTNPASLAGGTKALETVFPTAPFAPGSTIALAATVQGLPTPSTATPWVEYDGSYTGGCMADATHTWLQITPVGTAPVINAVPSAEIGLHLVDANIGLGNLVSLVHSEIGVWERKNARPARRS
jgi:hypothetical protein